MPMGWKTKNRGKLTPQQMLEIYEQPTRMWPVKIRLKHGPLFLFQHLLQETFGLTITVHLLPICGPLAYIRT